MRGECKGHVANVLSACFGHGDFTVTVLHPGGCNDGSDSAEVKRTEFRVWSVLLSKWSPIFDKMISSPNFCEASEKQVVIGDFSADAVETFLRFLYSGTVEGSLATLVEVAAMADKYQVDELLVLCTEVLQEQLTKQPELACELFACADRFQVANLRLEALEQIWIHAREALRTRPNLSLRLLDEVLNLDLLCADTEEIRELLISWGNSKKRKASTIKEEEEEVEDETDLFQASLNKHIARLSPAWRRTPEHSNDVLTSLWLDYEKAGKTGAFLGCWVSMILGPDSALSASDDPSLLQKYAANAEKIPRCLDYVVWMLPHSSVYIMGFSFAREVLGFTRFKICCSEDGSKWHEVFTSTGGIEKGELVACKRLPQMVRWFRLSVLEGCWSNSFNIHGILGGRKPTRRT
ncbi:bath-42 [Symbiodinium natans]|uniref:Bath-42 protein n=1 Tax=Symbiodinium natans TaxID=878477 RepID=A0A812V4W0_9DINO|nr:bath-42 [Symbiodinium natans]